MTELAFESSRNYSAGGGDDVRLDCVFSNRTDGVVVRRPGFWDGDGTFRVRFAPVSAGEWTWVTSCDGDPSLADRSGSFECVRYSGPLEIYRRGFVKATSGRKYFTYADGTPFFYLGDTHWGMYKEEIDEAGPHADGVKTGSHFKHIVDRRAEQGFTVYQSEPIGAKFNVMDGRIDASDIPGFQLADRYYRHIADAGLVHANAEFFFSASMRRPLMDDKVALERLSRYWVARFGAWPVMWTLAQEVDNDFYFERRDQRHYSYANNPWVAVAEFIHRHDAYGHPLSAHQENTSHTTVTGAGTSSKKSKISGGGVSVFASEEVARRTGHSWWAAQWSPSLSKTGSSAVPRDYWTSPRPAVNYEGRYCYLWTKDFGARAQGWISLLSGFCGYGYGAIDIWLYQSTYDVNHNSHDGIEAITKADKRVHWGTSLEFPSAIQMGHMKKFFTSFDWWRMKPLFGDGNGDFAPQCDAWHAAKIDGEARKFVFYFHSRNTKDMRTGAIVSARKGRVYSVRWFDPRSGAWVAPVDLNACGETGRIDLPPRPGNGDWALLVVEEPLGKESRGEAAKPVANPDWPNLEEVIIATKCHLDVGYTHTVPELIERYRTVYMDKALELFDSDRTKPTDLRVRWTMPAWLVDAILKGQYAPERRAKIEDAVRQRRLMWHALPFTSEPEASDVEELVRMFSYGSNLSRKFGFDLPRYAKQTDVPEYAWVMPTLLANAGVKFLQMGINPCSKSKAEVSKIPSLCWWEGPDGSRILLGFSPQYGWWGQGSVTPPKGWRHKTWLAYYMKGDNAGPMSRKEVDDILRQASEKLPGVKVRFGDPAEFADAIIAEEKSHPSLPVVRGDMPDTWIHGMMTLPETTAMHRRTTGDLVTFGQLDTTLRAFGIATEPVAELLNRAYRDSGLYSEHTWGMRGHRVRGPKLFQPDWRARYEAGEYKDFDATFQYHADYARRAHKAAQDGIKARMAALARSVAAEGPRVVVFNPLPYARDAVVEVEMPEEFSMPDGVREGGKVKFLAKGLPPGGYKTFTGIFNRVEHVERVEDLHDLHVLHGQSNKLRHFTVKFDLEKGGIASLVENVTGRELVKQGGHVLGQFLHERFSRNEVGRYSKIYNERQKNDGLSKPGMPDAAHSPYAAITPSGWRAHMKRSPLGVEVVMTPDDTKGLAKAYELRFTFPDHLPCVDIAWRVEGKTPDPIPEGGWLCLPFNVEGPSFRVGRIGGTIDPAKDIIFGANRDILCADRAITVRSGPGGVGVGVASADLPLWSLGRPGLWRYEPDYVPTEPEVFANLYNNQWNTNYPLWIPGSWSASLRVYPVAQGASEEQAIFTPAWEIRQPCVAAFADKKNSNRVEHVERVESLHDLHVLHGSKNQEGVSLSRKGVRLTAFCPNPDGDGIVLRVWEQAGVGGEITVSLPSGMKASEALPVNLRGESAGMPIPVKDGKFSFELNAWSPKSFIIIDAGS